MNIYKKLIWNGLTIEQKQPQNDYLNLAIVTLAIINVHIRSVIEGPALALIDHSMCVWMVALERKIGGIFICRPIMVMVIGPNQNGTINCNHFSFVFCCSAYVWAVAVTVNKRPYSEDLSCIWMCKYICDYYKYYHHRYMKHNYTSVEYKLITITRSLCIDIPRLFVRSANVFALPQSRTHSSQSFMTLLYLWISISQIRNDDSWSKNTEHFQYMANTIENKFE